MKTLFLLTFLLFTGIQSYAQQQPDPALYQQKVDSYKKLRNTGAGLAIGGSVLIVLSTIASESLGGSDASPMQNLKEGYFNGGSIACMLGAAAITVGAPLWIVGGVNHAEYSRKLRDFTVGLKLNPSRAGLTVTCRF
jgi:hypothetical protein